MTIRKSYEISVTGLVQGVGFRPFIHRLAQEFQLEGYVRNTAAGVSIVCCAEEGKIEWLVNELVNQAPTASGIKKIRVQESKLNGFSGFTIKESDQGYVEVTEISPDIAVCDQCLNDMLHQEHRLLYPFINCTHCGPRFTIIRELPYDRPNTSMDTFTMCGICSTEYHDISDRRYHAQPVACNHCGPEYTYRNPAKEIRDIAGIIQQAAMDLDSGKILSMKGLGGYHLVCDAFNQAAVLELRHRKQRDSKPFAVLFRNPDVVREFCLTNEKEDELLTSWRRPVVLLREKKPLASAVSNGLKTVGALLPYMPFHHLLFDPLKTSALVFTSGNLSDDPTIIDDQEAEEKLAPLSDACIVHNREICNRADDSVLRVAGGNLILIRRSRGYAPVPVDLDFDAEGILALGAEQKNTFCLGKGKTAILSQHIGDLKSEETCLFFREALDRFFRLFRFRPAWVACDQHPDYISTSIAEELSASQGIPLIRVQHHHAHIVSCMAENALEGQVIGVSFDGTGYGTDGNIWGGEFLIAGGDDFERFSHFAYVPMPGGDKAVPEPWRMAYSCLKTFLPDYPDVEKLPFLRDVKPANLDLVGQMIGKGVHTPLTSSAGRLFDAVAALTGICPFSTFDAEAAMRLESAVCSNVLTHYSFDAGHQVSFAKMFAEILYDLGKLDVSMIAAKFHNTLAEAILKVSDAIRKETGLGKVVLSGGVFQNRYLLEKTEFLLKENHFAVYAHSQVPANDGGISLGQLVVASQKRVSCV